MNNKAKKSVARGAYSYTPPPSQVNPPLPPSRSHSDGSRVLADLTRYVRNLEEERDQLRELLEGGKEGDTDTCGVVAFLQSLRRNIDNPSRTEIAEKLYRIERRIERQEEWNRQRDRDNERMGKALVKLQYINPKIHERVFLELSQEEKEDSNGK